MSISWSDIEGFEQVGKDVPVFGRTVRIEPMTIAVAGWIHRVVPKPVAPKKAVMGKEVENPEDPAYQRGPLMEYNRRVTVVTCAVALKLLDAGGITVQPGSAEITDKDRAWVEAVYAKLAPKLTDKTVTAILMAFNDIGDPEGKAISK